MPCEQRHALQHALLLCTEAVVIVWRTCSLARCAQAMGRLRAGSVGMPRPKKKKPTAIENLRAATAEVEQAAEAASSSSRAPELTSVTAPPPSPRKQKQLAAAARVRLAKKNTREFAKAVNDFARELEVAKRVWQFKGRKVDSTMKKDPIGSLCRQMKSNKELEMARDRLLISERNYLIREIVVRDNQLAVKKLELARLRRPRATPAAPSVPGCRRS